MHVQEIIKQVQHGKIDPIYVVYGTQKYWQDTFIQAVMEQTVGADADDFQVESFDLEQEPIEHAIDAAETVPFLSDVRLVIAQGATFLTGARRKQTVDHRLERLDDYVSAPPDYTVLILLVDHEKLDARKKIVKHLKKQATFVEAADLRSEHLSAWLTEQAEEKGVSITSEAAALLIQFSGDDLLLLNNELDKMALYIGQGETITPDVIRLLIARSVEQNVFTLIDLAVRFEVKQAMDSLQELFKRNEEPIKILFLFARQIRSLYKIKLLATAGYTRKQMAQRLKLHPYVCKLMQEQSRRFTTERLRHLLHELSRLDYQMKSGQMDKHLALELFVLRLPQAN